jgi:gamma-glutamyltranspeptidase/glutathione hydrolase
VASGHPLVSKAAVDILQQGGNAFDAAVAAGFVSCVAEPALTSLGGGGFMLAYHGGKVTLYDFFSDTPGLGLPPKDLKPHFFPVTIQFPGSNQIFNIGHGSVAVPGNLKGFLHIHRKLADLPLAKVLEPAIVMARDGIVVNRQQAYFLNLLKPILLSCQEGSGLFSINGTPLVPGDRYRNPHLADFLEILPQDGEESFYQGALAEKIHSQMRIHNGLLTQKDLHSYQVIERKPLICTSGRFTLLTNPPPSSGGKLIAQTMQLLKHLSLQEFSWGSHQHLYRVAEAMRQIDAASIRDLPLDQNSQEDWYRKTAAGIRTSSGGTTHISIRDSRGNVASMTTSNGEGSGCMVPDTGIMLNNMMGEDDLHPGGFHSSPPGIRISSMMSPSILLENGTPVVALGSGGSKRIRTAILQVLINIIDFGMDIEQAVLSPRIHWDGETLQMEPGFPAESVAALRAVMPVNLWTENNMYFGGVHAIAVDKGAADPRRGGAWQATKSEPSIE